MPVQTIFQPPGMPLVQVTTDFTGNSYVDEFGDTVQEERILSVSINNQTQYRWVITIFRNGSEIFSGNVASGFNNTFNVPGNRRVPLNSYSASIVRQ